MSILLKPPSGYATRNLMNNIKFKYRVRFCGLWKKDGRGEGNLPATHLFQVNCPNHDLNSYCYGCPFFNSYDTSQHHWLAVSHFLYPIQYFSDLSLKFQNLIYKNVVYWMGCETCNGQSMMLARGRNSWSMGDHKNRRSSGDLGNRLKINFLPVNCPLLLHLFFIDHKILPNIWYQSMWHPKDPMSEHRISS